MYGEDYEVAPDWQSSYIPYKDVAAETEIQTAAKESKYAKVTGWIIFILSIFTRLLYINSSNLVVWDEAHFGKFANFYLNGTFYFDVHPPLGKMTVAGMGYIAGYDGKFAFGSNSVYDQTVPIGYMRAQCALLGAFIPILVYGTCRNMKLSIVPSVLAATMMLFDNAILTISKFVLLDSILMFFMMLSVFCFTRFTTFSNAPFGKDWHKWLLFTGLSLGCTLSTKWVGLFTYAFIGIWTVSQLWETLPVVKQSIVTYKRHWFFRITHLILVPTIVYMASFYLHFTILRKSGSGDALMSSKFQSHLNGSTLQMSRSISYNNVITLRNNGYGGGLLHSHPHSYPYGSKQTQVTVFNSKDSNNNFRVLSPWKEEKMGLVQDNDTIRLFHVNTRRNLHSHNLGAPIHTFDNEVSLYGNLTIGDTNDHWIVELQDDIYDISGIQSGITPVKTTFALKHANLGCYLCSSGSKLPEWAYSQGEALCTKKFSRKCVWNVEDIVDSDQIVISDGKEAVADYSYDSRTFLRDFVDLNVAMWNGNNGLTPKPGKRDHLISAPSSWMLLEKGLRMCNWSDESVKYYLLGNPVVWWSVAVAMFFYIVHFSIYAMKLGIDGYAVYSEGEHIKTTGLLFLGWVLHYVPFFMMGRVTYLHHYFPALTVGTLTVAKMIDAYQSRAVAIAMMILITANFIYFAPLSYGFTGPAQQMEGRMWREGWKIAG